MSIRIAIVTPLYWPSVGGTQTLTHEIAQYLANEGDTVKVFTSRARSGEAIDPKSAKVLRDYPKLEFFENIEIRRYDAGGRISWIWGLGYRLLYRLNLPQNRFFYDRSRASGAQDRRMIHDIAAFKPDVIFGTPYMRFLFEILLRAQKKTGALLVIQTSIHFDAPTSLEPGYDKLTACEAVVTNTRHEKNKLVEAGLTPEKVHVVGPAFDPLPSHDLEVSRPYSPPVMDLEGHPYALFIARKSEDKGVPALLEAMQIVARQRPDARLVLVGESTPYFERMRPSLATRPEIVDAGVVDDTTKETLLAGATVFAMPSRIDSFGIVYMEAWTRGVPVIAADTPTMRGVVEDGVDGRLVPFGDAQRLADILLELFTDKKEAKRLGDTGRRRTFERTAHKRIQKKIREILTAESPGSGKP